MIIGVPREIKDGECRVGLAPQNAAGLVSEGHAVWVEKGAGVPAGFSDAEYRSAGAKLSTAAALWAKADCMVKVKEPLPSEYKYFKKGKIVFSYLHLAANAALTQALIKSGVSAVAAETVQDKGGRFPILEPMSELAGRMSIIIAAYFEATRLGGSGILMPGLPGVLPAKVMVLGGGTVGENAARIASGMGAQVTILDNRADRLRQLDEMLPENVSTLISNPANIALQVAAADIIIGAVLVAGAKTPKLITKKMLRGVKKRALFIDVCIDQGGVSETSRPTSHSEPTYSVGNVLHYCVPNMPGAYGHTATLAFTNAIAPYVSKLGKLGLSQILGEDPGFSSGLQVHEGSVTYKPVAESLNLNYTDLKNLF